MVGLQGEGWGTRDPFQFGDQEITHLQGALEGRGQARRSRIWGTDKQASPQLPPCVIVGYGERGQDTKPEPSWASLLGSVDPWPGTQGIAPQIMAITASPKPHGKRQGCQEGRSLWGLRPGK